jgi:hypothetical protein
LLYIEGKEAELVVTNSGLAGISKIETIPALKRERGLRLASSFLRQDKSGAPENRNEKDLNLIGHNSKGIHT